MLAVYIGTTHDGNGNPRRGWMIVDDTGRTVDFIDEGYQGTYALTSKYPGIASTERLTVVTSEYNSLKG